MSNPTNRTAEHEGRVLSLALAAAAIVLLGVGARIIGLANRGLWLDEAITVSQASRSFLGVVADLASGVHPPLYHVLIHFWMSAFGRGEIAIRSFSVVVGVAAIPAAFWAGARIYDRRTGLIAAALVALSPFHVWYSQEARMYALLFLAGLLSTAFLALATRENRPRLWVGYLVATLVGLFTHYFFLFLMLGQVAFYLLGELVPRLRRAREAGFGRASLRRPWLVFADVRTLAPALACALVFAALMGVWAANSVLVPQADGGANALLSSVGGSGLGYGQEAPRLAFRFNDVALVVVQMFGGFHSTRIMDAIVSMWPLLIYLVLMLMHLVKPIASRTWVLLTASGGIVLILLLGQWQGQLLAARYVMAVAGPAFLLGARVLAKLARRASVPVAAGLVVVALLAWGDQSFAGSNGMRYDNREALQTIAAEYRPGDTVIYLPFYLDPLTRYYLPSRITAHGFPQYEGTELRDSLGQIDEDLDRVVGRSQRVWVFLSFQNIPKLRSRSYEIRYWLKRNGYASRLDRRLNQVQLLRYDAIRESPPRFFIRGDVSRAGEGRER